MNMWYEIKYHVNVICTTYVIAAVVGGCCTLPNCSHGTQKEALQGIQKGSRHSSSWGWVSSCTSRCSRWRLCARNPEKTCYQKGRSLSQGPVYMLQFELWFHWVVSCMLHHLFMYYVSACCVSCCCTFVCLCMCEWMSAIIFSYSLLTKCCTLQMIACSASCIATHPALCCHILVCAHLSVIAYLCMQL